MLQFDHKEQQFKISYHAIFILHLRQLPAPVSAAASQSLWEAFLTCSASTTYGRSSPEGSRFSVLVEDTDGSFGESCASKFPFEAPLDVLDEASTDYGWSTVARCGHRNDEELA
jgi:hypothetical protein